MTITRLDVADFRSYAALSLDPGPGFVVLTGDNGAGKTNILEAVSLLSPGRGLRGASLPEMARKGGAGHFGVAARLGDVTLGTGTETNTPERRLVRVNGAPASANALSEWLSLVWLTPAMDRLFVEGAAERRRFLDRLVLALDPGHARNASRYEAAMRQRNRLLGEERADPEWLGALEAQMADHGRAIASARARLVDLLAQTLAGANEDASVFAHPSLALDGWRDDGDFAAELRLGRRRDAAAGRALAGPHRSDLAVVHATKGQPAGRCSTGEQKALLLAIVIAHADLVAGRTGRRPILLFDEVAAHLDERRRAALFERLEGRGQVWVTGTDRTLFRDLPGPVTHFAVVDGQARPA